MLKKTDIFRKRKKRDDGRRNRGKIPPTAHKSAAKREERAERRA